MTVHRKRFEVMLDGRLAKLLFALGDVMPRASIERAVPMVLYATSCVGYDSQTKDRRFDRRWMDLADRLNRETTRRRSMPFRKR